MFDWSTVTFNPYAFCVLAMLHRSMQLGQRVLAGPGDCDSLPFVVAPKKTHCQF